MTGDRSSMSVTVTETTFETWEDCLSLSNGVVELVVTTGVGPRVLSCGFADGPNLLFTDESRTPLDGYDEYRIHGGHRLWHAPEDAERTYVPDNDPVKWTELDGGVELAAPVETETGIRKTLSVRLAADRPVAEVTHELGNAGAWPVELAPWAITVFEADARAVVPLSRRGEGLLPDRSLSLWPYTDLADDRLTTAPETLLVEGDPGADGAFKVGASGANEWAGCVVDGVGFVKEFAYDETATYPDRGSAVEVYTDGSVLELETLGPLVELDPGESAVHTETWRLLDATGLDAGSAAASGDLVADLRTALAPP